MNVVKNPAFRHAEFLNPNQCMQPRAITHPKMPHSPHQRQVPVLYQRRLYPSRECPFPSRVHCWCQASYRISQSTRWVCSGLHTTPANRPGRASGLAPCAWDGFLRLPFRSHGPLFSLAGSWTHLWPISVSSAEILRRPLVYTLPLPVLRTWQHPRFSRSPERFYKTECLENV